jgi:putative transposase
MWDNSVRTARFSERERKQILQEGHTRGTVREVCQQYGISIRTFYRWQAMSIQQEKVQIVRLRDLERENRRLKQQIAELSLDYHALRAALVKESRSES